VYGRPSGGDRRSGCKRTAIMENAFPNIVLKSAPAAGEIEGSADYAQKNDDFD
jgi:hypothetical protein